MDLKLQALFPTYVTSTMVAEHSELNNDIIKASYKIKDNSEGVHSSNLDGWHSETDLFLRKEECFKELTDIIIKFAQASVKKLNPKISLSEYKQEMNGWININPPGGLNVPHDHPDWEMSGTYYVQAPEGKRPEDGCFEFIDPKTSSYASKIYFGNGVERRFLIKPKPGLLISFPSYVRHWVRPNYSNSDRISIAWNYRLVKN
jgi:uncharacterized protein (TIGR02466 family)